MPLPQKPAQLAPPVSIVRPLPFVLWGLNGPYSPNEGPKFLQNWVHVLEAGCWPSGTQACMQPDADTFKRADASFASFRNPRRSGAYELLLQRFPRGMWQWRAS